MLFKGYRYPHTNLLSFRYIKEFILYNYSLFLLFHTSTKYIAMWRLILSILLLLLLPHVAIKYCTTPLIYVAANIITALLSPSFHRRDIVTVIMFTYTQPYTHKQHSGPSRPPFGVNPRGILPIPPSCRRLYYVYLVWHLLIYSLIVYPIDWSVVILVWGRVW